MISEKKKRKKLTNSLGLNFLNKTTSSKCIFIKHTTPHYKNLHCTRRIKFRKISSWRINDEQIFTRSWIFDENSWIIPKHWTWRAIKKAIKGSYEGNDIYRSICWPFYDFSMKVLHTKHSTSKLERRTKLISFRCCFGWIWQPIAGCDVQIQADENLIPSQTRLPVKISRHVSPFHRN